MTTGGSWTPDEGAPSPDDSAALPSGDPSLPQAQAVPPAPVDPLAAYELEFDPKSPWLSPPAKARWYRRKRTWLAAAAALAAIAVGVSLLVDPTPNPAAAPASNPRSPVPSTLASETDPGEEVAAVLARRTTAVKDRDRAAFLADLDPSAKEFVTRQTLMFKNLMKLPLTHVRWAAVQERVAASDLSGYGAPASVEAVEFTYQLKGFDHRPVARPMAFTFVHRGERWLLAGDGDATDLPTARPPEPWEVTPIIVRTSGHALVIGEERDREVLGSLAAKADAALTQVRRMWKAPGQNSIVVYVPRQKRLHELYLDGVPDLAAAYEFSVYTHVSAWAAATPKPAGTRVVLNTYRARPQDKQIPALMRHEATHVATAPWTRSGAPTWLVEGAAEYTAYRDDPYSRLFPNSVFKAAAAGHLMTSFPANKKFYSLATGYDRTYLFCYYVKTHYGESKLIALYRTAGSIAKQSKTVASVKKDIQSVLGVSQERLLSDFNSWARNNVRAA